MSRSKGRTRKIRFPALASAQVSLLLAISCPAQTASQSSSVLQRRYEAAQKFQAANDLPHAAEQYRIFIADSLGQVAIGRAHASEYERAADDFDEALRLVPAFPLLQLEYARAALAAGNPQHARTLCMGILAGAATNSKAIAGAHAVLGLALLKLNKDAEAKAQFEAAVALDPDFENGYGLAIADLDLGDHDGAAQIFKEMLASFGDTATMHLYFGQAYGTSDFQTDAVREFQLAAAKDPHLPGVHYALAAAYLSTAGGSKENEAIGELRTEIANSPKNATAYAALGHLLADGHTGGANDAEVEHDLRLATTLDPRDPDGFLYLGQFLADAKRLPEAESALRQSIAFTTDVTRHGYQVQKAHYLLGRLLLQTSQAEEGKQQIAISKSLAEQNLSQDQNRLADYLQDSNPVNMANAGPSLTPSSQSQTADPEASRKVDELEKQIGPAIADSYNNLGAIAGSENDYREALRCFQHAAQWNPSMPGLDENWGRAAFQAGDFPQAVSLLTRILAQHPDDSPARASLGISQVMTRNFAAAKATLQPLDAKPGETPEVCYAYAASLVQTGDLRSGIARLQALEKEHPQVPEVHRTLGEAYVLARSSEAARELQEAIRLNPKDAEALAALGHLQNSHGQRKAAMQNLAAASQLDPGNVALRKEVAAAEKPAAKN